VYKSKWAGALARDPAYILRMLDEEIRAKLVGSKPSLAEAGR
jgi:hypothetical protein